MLGKKTTNGARRSRRKAKQIDARFVSMSKAGKILGVGRTLIYEFANAGMLKTFKVNNRRLCSVKSVNELADRIEKEGGITVLSDNKKEVE